MIDSLIRQGRSFAIYRIPGEEEPRFVMQASGSARLLYNIEDLNEQQGFVIAPFRVSRECPIVLIRRDYSELPDNSQPDYIRMEQKTHPNGRQKTTIHIVSIPLSSLCRRDSWTNWYFRAV